MLALLGSFHWEGVMMRGCRGLLYAEYCYKLLLKVTNEDIAYRVYNLDSWQLKWRRPQITAGLKYILCMKSNWWTLFSFYNSHRSLYRHTVEEVSSLGIHTGQCTFVWNGLAHISSYNSYTYRLCFKLHFEWIYFKLERNHAYFMHVIALIFRHVFFLSQSKIYWIIFY